MIDPADQQTQQLPLETKRRPGRPSTGKAKSRAEIQRAYRERSKGNVTDNSAEIATLRAEIEELKIALGKERAARKKAEAKLISVTENRNQRPVKAWDIERRFKGGRKWIAVEGEPFDAKETAERCMQYLAKQNPIDHYRLKEISLA
jgi:hypothetical protein